MGSEGVARFGSASILIRSLLSIGLGAGHLERLAAWLVAAAHLERGARAAPRRHDFSMGDDGVLG